MLAHAVGHAIPLGADVTLPAPLPAVATLSVHVGVITLNDAVTLFAASIVTVHVGVTPLHAPLHPPNVLPVLVVAVSVTVVPAASVAEQLPGQSMPPTLDATAPDPVPATATVSGNVAGGANVAVTLCAAVIVTTHGPVPEHAPLQPANVLPLVGVAVSVTCVPST